MRTDSWAILALLATVPLAAQQPFLPVDEASSRPDFFSFRAQLQRAIARHDTVALLARLRRGDPRP
jgi:hypothetical protein